jgi:oligopeptide/dipeptide ABC transporter ATP-binding protein
MSPPLLEIEDLAVHFPGPDGPVRAVDGLSLTVERGHTLGVVGESGSGKSVTFLAAMRLLDRSHPAVSGRITLDGIDLLAVSDRQMRRIRGPRIGMIFQDPLSALHPLLRIGDQIAETIRAHRDVGRRDAAARAVAALASVGIPNADERARQYPHQLSGGMRQRVMIAMALVLEPELLIADEPTTALDTTVEAQILQIIDDLRTRLGMGVVLVSHSLATVADTADAVIVMYAGRAAERGPCREVFADPQHPYTWGLLDSLPTLETQRHRLVPIPGSPPSLVDPPPGCRFAARCQYRFDACTQQLPELVERGNDHADACLLPETGRGGRRRAAGNLGAEAAA